MARTQSQNGRNGRTRRQFDETLWHIAQREGARRIKLHEEAEKAHSKKEAVALTSAGLPDMRFAEDKVKFSDPRRRVRDGKPDRRFLENRPDLVEARRQRGQGHVNFIFTDDMIPDNVDEIANDVQEAEAGV